MTFDPAAAGWEPYADEGFIGLVGPFWSRQCGDSFVYAFMAEKKHHNRRGVVQGGMLMTFADRSMGMTCWYANEQQPQATVQLDMHFIDAVQIGEFVECQVPGGAPHAIAGLHERRVCCRRPRGRDGERRLEDIGCELNWRTRDALNLGQLHRSPTVVCCRTSLRTEIRFPQDAEYCVRRRRPAVQARPLEGANVLIMPAAFEGQGRRLPFAGKFFGRRCEISPAFFVVAVIPS